MKPKFDIYEKINNEILKNLENAGSWQKMWTGGLASQNLHSGHNYRGINVFLLWGADKPYWMTFNQIRENKLKLKKGAKSKFIVFWKPMTKKVKEGVEEKIIVGHPILRYYNVFNIKDIEIPEDHKILDKIKELEPEMNENPVLENPQKIISEFMDREKIGHTDADSAYYRPSTDSVGMPELGRFKNSESYYSVFFHEMSHSTGHKKRLNRDTLTQPNFFGGHEYSKEELVAELGAAYLSNICGINTEKTEKNTAAYLKSWLGVLRDHKNKSFLTWAIPRAEKAARYILNEPLN